MQAGTAFCSHLTFGHGSIIIEMTEEGGIYITVGKLALLRRQSSPTQPSSALLTAGFEMGLDSHCAKKLSWWNNLRIQCLG